MQRAEASLTRISLSPLLLRHRWRFGNTTPTTHHLPPTTQYESFAALKKTGAAEFEVHVRAGGGSPTAWIKAGCVVSEGDATEAAIQYQRQLIIAHGLAMTPGLKVREVE